MGDENPICTLGDYSKPSHECYRNTIELPKGNNVCEIDRAADGKLRNKNADESWEIIKNLALYDHEGWDDTKEFFKPVKAITAPLGITKTPDRRLLELEDQINFLLNGSRPAPTSSSARAPQDFVKASHLNSRPQNQNEPPTLNTFAFHERTCRSPQPQALETTFEARVRDYIVTHTERMERFENTIFKKLKEINGMEMPIKEAETKDEAENRAGNESIKISETKEVVEAPGSQPVAYYLKHKINENLIKGLVNNNSLSGTRVGKKKKKAYNVLPRGPVYEAIHKKKITKKEDIGGNFEIHCSIGDVKHVHVLVDQGSNVNIMPYSTYMKLTDERPAETDIKLLLASHSYIYPLGIAKDVLVEVAEHIYPAEFIIMDIKENEMRPFILGMPFLTTVKASIKFDTSTITLRSGKSKISFYRIHEPLFHVEKGIKNDIEPIAPTMIVNRLVLEWEERIRLHQEKEMEFNQWRSKNFKDERPALTEEEE
ncbi:MAK10-like protein [Tanacetum coccineum]